MFFLSGREIIFIVIKNFEFALCENNERIVALIIFDVDIQLHYQEHLFWRTPIRHKSGNHPKKYQSQQNNELYRLYILDLDKVLSCSCFLTFE